MPEMADLGCLYFESSLLSWDAARNNCKALGGDLFVPADGEQFFTLGNYYYYDMEVSSKRVASFFLLRPAAALKLFLRE